MFLRTPNTSYKFYSTVSISKTKIMNMGKCYFRYNQNENKVDLTFLFQVKGSVRQFNFSRKSTETVETLLTRIGANVQKVAKKGNKKKGDALEGIPVSVYHKDNKTLPEAFSCLDLFTLEGPVKLQIKEQLYDVVFNTPWIENMTLPHSILSGFPVYPENFVSQYTDKLKSDFNWYTGVPVNDKGNEVSEIHIKWELVGTGDAYVSTTLDIGKKLKLECIPGNDSSTGPIVEAISKNVVEAGPGKCPFETRQMFTKTLLSANRFRCVTYNILADLYCDSDFTRTSLHPYCPPYALHIAYRKQLFLKEILGYNADVICLQEVDKKIFHGCLNPVLSAKGLNGLFYKKGKEVAEGLACFYRKDRFGFLGQEHIILSQALKTESYLKTIWNAVQSNKTLAERVLDRSTAATATLLISHDNPNEILVVGNTHLYFHPDADHIRLIQGGVVISWLQHIKDDLTEKFPDKRVSLILCGDFNSVPSCGIYKLYTTGLAPESLADWTSNLDQAVRDLRLEQKIILGSACGTPPFTNFTAGFADCLDYIFYEKSSIKVEQVIPLPSVEELQAHTALPSIVFPSDHIALISDLQFVT